ncbi:MAG: gamma-glutamyltransferase family protein, partial [Actinomycetota bacterium]
VREDTFRDPSTGMALPFDEVVNSGLSVGVPGTPLTWEVALKRWGTVGLRRALAPAISLAERGFVVDETFQEMVARNADRFSRFTSTAKLYLPGGRPPAVGSRFANPDLAETYRFIARDGADILYRGELGREVVRAVQRPPVVPDATRPVRPGLMKRSDLARYRAPPRRPTRVTYRGLEVYGMAPPSSGGSTIGEALNILERFDLSAMTRAQVLHHELEASRLAFADRNRYVGDPDFVDVALTELLSKSFAGERACLVRHDRASTSPIPPGSPDGEYAACDHPTGAGAPDPHEQGSTTHLVAADARGDVVAYTLTIEQEGGSGIVVPEHGFLLNNELTDFNFMPTQGDAADPNLPAPGKRPRSSLAPTIVLRGGHPLLAVGSPGGSTIITTVLGILVDRLDLGLSLPGALAAPRFAQRNTAATSAEAAFLASPERLALDQLGHRFIDDGEIGAATGLEFLDPKRVQAVAEPVRRGGGAAMVVIEEGSHAR